MQNDSHVHDTGQVESDTGRGSSPESPQTDAVTAGVGNGTDESRPGTYSQTWYKDGHHPQPAEQGFEATLKTFVGDRQYAYAGILDAHRSALADEMGRYQTELKGDYDEDIREAVVRELEALSMDVIEPCEPDCDEVRHARHTGSWNAHLKIDQRLAQLGGKQ